MLKLSIFIERSLEDLKSLLEQGYDTVTFENTDGACQVCTDRNGESKSLVEFIENTTHDAPIYSWSHPGCDCIVIVNGPGLEPVQVDFLGVKGERKMSKKEQVIRKSEGFDAYVSMVERKFNEKLSNTVNTICNDLVKLCNKVTVSAISKISSTDTIKNEETPNIIKVICKVEVWDKGIKKLAEVPITLDCETETYTPLTEEELLKLIEDTKEDTTLKDAVTARIKAQMDAIDTNIKLENDAYYNIKPVETPIEKEAFVSDCPTIIVNKISYPKTWVIGMTIPLDGLKYTITGEDATSWTLARADLVSPCVEAEEQKKRGSL